MFSDRSSVGFAHEIYRFPIRCLSTIVIPTSKFSDDLSTIDLETSYCRETNRQVYRPQRILY